MDRPGDRHIEDRLFAALAPLAGASRLRRPDGAGLFLYDVTSSYLEGVCSELAAFGYNRDGKKGKRQIIIGLLCNTQGQPLSIEVFAGNTQDPATMASQIRKVAQRCRRSDSQIGGGAVTSVGDRGMIRGRQIKDLATQGFHYITAITKSPKRATRQSLPAHWRGEPQIESLLARGVLTMSLFDVAIATPRQLNRQNRYLQEHPKARTPAAVGKIMAQCRKRHLDTWVQVTAQERVLALTLDESAVTIATPRLAEQQKLDGCYVLQTDLTPPQLNAQDVHARYKDLAMVEWAFRTSKSKIRYGGTMQLEMRPVHVRLARRTRGHALAIILSYKIVQVAFFGDLPAALPHRGVHVATRKKLPLRRKTH